MLICCLRHINIIIIIINIKNTYSAQYVSEKLIFLWISLMNIKLKSVIFKTITFCNIIIVFTVISDQTNPALLTKTIKLLTDK